MRGSRTRLELDDDFSPFHVQPHAQRSLSARTPEHCLNVALGSDSSFQQASLEQVLAALAPSCSEAARTRLKEEGIETSLDLAGLDVPDLRKLLQDMGLRMIERGRVLRWAAVTEGERLKSLAETKTGRLPRRGSFVMEGDADRASSAVEGTAGTPARQISAATLECLLLQSDDETPRHRLQRTKTLDELEGNAEFWCQIIGNAPLRKDILSQSLSRRDAQFSNAVMNEDFRENVIEDLFDLNPERLKEIYDSVDRDNDGRIRKDELCEALLKCGVHGLEDTLEKVLNEISVNDDLSLDLSAFESMLTRLKLAQLLTQLTASTSVKAVAKNLIITDYNPKNARQFVLDDQLRTFFFGHRDEEYPMRWVHMNSFDMTLFLALTVKYQLHPLCVEDVIHQSISKVDRYGEHYFVSIEHLCLVGAEWKQGQGVVQVQGRHVTIFAAGPPHFDTIITVAQPDRSFSKDWPGRHSEVPNLQDPWVEKLQKRLKATRSRARERLADYLMYAIIDLCADDLLAVTRAFTARLTEREEKLRLRRLTSEQEKLEWFDEVGVIRLQIAVVSRRLRGLKGIVRRLGDDSDMAPVHQYLADVADHVNDAYGDAGHLQERAQHLLDAYEHCEDRAADRKQQEAALQQAEWQKLQTMQDERMNRTLFILTVSTTLFTPLTFITGVYGMNFVNSAGKPTIPELVNPSGYFYFWCFVVIYLVCSGFCVLYVYRRLTRMQRRLEDADHPRIGSNHDCGESYAMMSP